MVDQLGEVGIFVFTLVYRPPLEKLLTLKCDM